MFIGLFLILNINLRISCWNRKCSVIVGSSHSSPRRWPPTVTPVLSARTTVVFEPDCKSGCQETNPSGWLSHWQFLSARTIDGSKPDWSIPSLVVRNIPSGWLTSCYFANPTLLHVLTLNPLLLEVVWILFFFDFDTNSNGERNSFVLLRTNSTF